MSFDASDSGNSIAEYDALPQPRPTSRPANAKDWLVVALDKPTVGEAARLVKALDSLVDIYKVGLELVLAGDGLDFAYKLQQEQKKRIFLDMKLLDIPNTVEKAVTNVARKGFEFLTVHAHDKKTLDAAVSGKRAAGREGERLKLLGVTVLTSNSQDDIREQGLTEHSLELAIRRAKMACEAGFDGVIASGHEAKHIWEATKSKNPDFIIKVPGIRPAGSNAGDQSRIMTPTEALRRHATYLVIGRPITEANNPALAAQAILDEIQSYLLG